MATREEMNTEFRASNFVLRNPSSHAEHLRMLEGDDYSIYSREYGINGRSVLGDLQYFDVSGGSLIPDIMHDVLEGALQYEAKLVLKQFINRDHYFTLAQLNQKIEAFDLSYTEAVNRPSTISATTINKNDNSLKQSGRFRIALSILKTCFSPFV